MHSSLNAGFAAKLPITPRKYLKLPETPENTMVKKNMRPRKRVT